MATSRLAEWKALLFSTITGLSLVLSLVLYWVSIIYVAPTIIDPIPVGLARIIAGIAIILGQVVVLVLVLRAVLFLGRRLLP